MALNSETLFPIVLHREVCSGFGLVVAEEIGII